MKTILFVEDDPMSRDVILIRLKRSNYEVIAVSDGYQALSAVLTRSFDLILLDMSMPGISGWETARKLKESPETALIPILGLSAHTMSTDRQKAIDAGCSDYDSKPINLPRLLEKIEALISSTQGSETQG
jgi:two-component system cell cycle response regulator DivK